MLLSPVRSVYQGVANGSNFQQVHARQQSQPCSNFMAKCLKCLKCIHLCAGVKSVHEGSSWQQRRTLVLATHPTQDRSTMEAETWQTYTFSSSGGFSFYCGLEQFFSSKSSSSHALTSYSGSACTKMTTMPECSLAMHAWT